MKKIIVLLVTFCICITSVCFARVYVKGYFRKDGTYVAPHYRTSPDSTITNNYSYPGNYNPNTGEITSGSSSTYTTPSTPSTSTYNSYSSYSSTTSNNSSKISNSNVSTPTYPVKINSSPIENYCGNWKPFVYNDITYIPMTSYVMQELNLASSFDSITGFNVSNNSVEKAQFLDKFIVIIPTGTSIYHKYGCPYLDLTSFSACNEEIAIDCEFMKCNYCCGF